MLFLFERQTENSPVNATNVAAAPRTLLPLIQYPRVQFDFGAIGTLPAELAVLRAVRPLFVTDQGLVACGVFDTVRAAMPSGAELAVFDRIPENPTVQGVEQALEVYRERRCDAVVAVGGGSVIDSCKAISVMATHPGRVGEYLGRAEKITPDVAPLIAVPTTSGTGSEVSRGAGIHPTSSSRGGSLGSPFIVPKTAICDPDLTLTLPPLLTAATGMDALSHAVEGLLAKTVNPVGDAIAVDAITRVCDWLPKAVRDGADREARWHMMMASMEAMLVSKGLGAAHALANTFGDQGLHHGTLVTLALPPVLRGLDAHAGERIRRLADAMRLGTGRHPGAAIAEMNQALGLPADLRSYGYKLADLDEAAADAHASWFNRSAPYHPTKDEFKTMITEIIG